MIVLKNLAKEFNIEPYVLRRMLREEFGKVKGMRWRWDNDKDKNLVRIRKFLCSRFSSSKPNSTT